MKNKFVFEEESLNESQKFNLFLTVISFHVYL